MKIDWKSKLSSRKFWVALVGFVTAMAVVFGIDNLTIEKVAGLITAGGVLIAYIITEGAVDISRSEDKDGED